MLFRTLDLPSGSERGGLSFYWTYRTPSQVGKRERIAVEGAKNGPAGPDLKSEKPATFRLGPWPLHPLNRRYPQDLP